MNGYEVYRVMRKLYNEAIGINGLAMR